MHALPTQLLELCMPWRRNFVPLTGSVSIMVLATHMDQDGQKGKEEEEEEERWE